MSRSLRCPYRRRALADRPAFVACPPDKALGKTITVDFTQGASDQFSLANGTTLTYGSNGAEFIMVKEDDAPTITSVWYIFFGRVDVTLQAAPGTGIVSSFVMESDDLDEIDMVRAEYSSRGSLEMQSLTRMVSRNG